MSRHLGAVRATEWWILTGFPHLPIFSCSNKLIKAEPSPFFDTINQFLLAGGVSQASLPSHHMTKPLQFVSFYNCQQMFLLADKPLHQFTYVFVCGVWPVKSSELVTTSTCSSSQRHRWVFHLCVDCPSFTSIEEDWCNQCSQQTNSGFHRYVRISPGINQHNITHETQWSMTLQYSAEWLSLLLMYQLSIFHVFKFDVSHLWTATVNSYQVAQTYSADEL